MIKRQKGDKTRPSVFISYARPDSYIAVSLADLLASRQHDVFMDQRLPVGERWSGVLSEAIASSELVIVLMSADYFLSRWAQAELAQALGSKKRILPVLVGPCEVERPLSYYQWLDLTRELDATGDRLAGLRRVVELVEGPG